MSALSDAQTAAFAALIDGLADDKLAILSPAVASMPGEKARALHALMAEAATDRRRRGVALAPLIPMFRPRADGVAALSFPRPVLARLWGAGSAREPHLLPRLDDEAAIAAVVGDRICQAAASRVRDAPDVIWPTSTAPADRAQGLAELAACLDLTPLARRAVASLQTWLKRPDDDQVAEMRLLLKDAAAVTPDGAQRMLEIVFAHLDDAVLILRILTQSSKAAEKQGFLSASELAGFVERILDAVEARVARLGAPGGEAQAAADLSWCAVALSEIDVTLAPEADSDWGKRVRAARVTLAKRVVDTFRAADKAVERALPMARVRIGTGRATRPAPDLTVAPAGDTAEQALTLLRGVGEVRGAAGVFGCETDRKRLVDSLTDRLSAWGDEAVGMINDGEAPDEGRALALVELCAACLERIEAVEPARSLRRRAAVAGAHSDGAEASSRAA